jgi:hypothetical protein
MSLPTWTQAIGHRTFDYRFLSWSVFNMQASH